MIMKFREFMLLAILCTTTFFIYNTALPADIMEARNIITAREIADNDTWLVPTMNGELRLEKPPLPTWIAGAIECVSPDSLGSQRLAAGIMAVIWIAFFYMTAFYIGQRRDYALYATLIFMTCYNVIQMGRTATWDIYCHAFMMGGIYFLMRGLYDDYFRERQRPWLYLPLAGVMMGLSFLSKGPVSFYALLLPALISAPIFIRPLNINNKWKPFVVMIVICLALSSWWYIYLMVYHPAEVAAVIQKESGSWVDHNVRPWYYYWRFFCETGVWAPLMLVTLFVPFWNKRLPEKRGFHIVITWMFVDLILLSLMPEKKMRYLLPMMVPCALSMGYVIMYFKFYCRKDRQAEKMYLVIGGIISVITFALPVLVFIFGYKRDSMHFDSYVGITLLLLLAGIWIAKATWQRDAPQLVLGVAALFAVICSFLLRPISNLFDNPDKRSIHEISKIDLPFYHNADEELRIELVYEACHQIRPVNLRDENALEKALPCVVITRKDIKEILTKEQQEKLDIQSLGVFDDNKHPKSDQHYTSLFINHATILKEKK